MSDTPETDALREAIDNGAAVEAEMTSLAKKLEREIVAQEERQAAAGDRCGLPFWEYGFDWPDAVSDELLRTREDLDQVCRELDIQLESIKFHMERIPIMEHPLRADDAPLQDSGAEPQPLREGEPSDFCGAIRRMRDAEHERNEAREALKSIEEYGTEEINAAVDLRHQLAAALCERDEAREMQVTALRERESTEREVDAMLERAIKAERERDEARATAESLRDQLCADKCRDKAAADGDWANI